MSPLCRSAGIPSAPLSTSLPQQVIGAAHKPHNRLG